MVEPLKGKKHISMMGEPRHYVEWYTKEQIKSAVEWLMDKINNMYAPEVKVIVKDRVKELIDEAFEDVMKKD